MRLLLIISVKLAIENPKSTIYHLGGNGYLKKNEFNESEVAKLFYSNVGFDLNRVRFIGNSRNTIENFYSIKNENIFEKSNILITSAHHMKRAMIISKRLNMTFIPYAVDFKTMKEFRFVPSLYLLSNVNALQHGLHEWLGLISYYLMKRTDRVF